MQLELDVRRYHRNIGFTLVLVLHGLVAWGLLNSKIRLPIPEVVDSPVLALIARPQAMQMHAGGSGVAAMSGSLAPPMRLPVAVDFVPVSVEESSPAALPVVARHEEAADNPLVTAAPNSAGASPGSVKPAGAGKYGADEMDYESLPAAMLAIECPSPPYPSEAIDKAQSGTVRLALLIDAQGRVVESRVIRSSKAPALDRASREAIASCQFIPAARNGVAAQGWVMLNYIWTLHLKPGVIH